MVCYPPDSKIKGAPILTCRPQPRALERGVDALFESSRTSWVSGHHRKCTAELSEDAFVTLISPFINTLEFHVESSSTHADDLYSYVHYQFETRSMEVIEDSIARGRDWGPSGLHVYNCKDALNAEYLFKEWIGSVYPGWTPRPLDMKEFSVGQYALEHDYGLVYWIRNNIFVKIDVDDMNISTDTVHRLANSIDDYLVAGSVMIGYEAADQGTT
ncbi:hypothetical protein H072_5432 [Dactylellina haptotyla CBS 200.50]|uniref:Uncharacterized protein n=1 Tax=Dactylellina haptotyla (strain CBS 200.50) TaxID=1284197 RepID=S8ACJ8_DACHA|nr:hypothetical protein H072_5432 [Dactylellina haptotyla CBS 200.50]